MSMFHIVCLILKNFLHVNHRLKNSDMSHLSTFYSLIPSPTDLITIFFHLVLDDEDSVNNFVGTFVGL